MDFLDPNKKRQHKIRLFVGYVLIAIAIAFGSLILLFQSYGYDLDRQTGEVIQNGLMFVSSTPDDAAVYLNGRLERDRTNSRLAVPSGQYVVEIKKSGYRDWKRSVSLEGGVVERLTYPLLIPQTLAPGDVQLYSAAPAFASQSPDRRWLLVQQPGRLVDFDLFDLNSDNPTAEIFSLPDGLVTNGTGPQTWEEVEWAGDNRHALFIHHFEGGQEHILLDRENAAESVNLDRLFDKTAKKVLLRDGQADEFYVLDAVSGSLDIYDLRGRQLRTVLSSITDFRPRGADMIVYLIAGSPTPEQFQFRLFDGSNSYDLRTFNIPGDYLFDIARQDNDWFVALAPAADDHTYIYKNPLNVLKSKNKLLTPTSILKVDMPANLRFSASGQFVMVQNGAKFGTYDVETDRRYYFETQEKNDTGQPAAWMDGNRLVMNPGNKTLIFDFEGSNEQILTASNPGFLPYFDGNYSAVYDLAPSTVANGRSALTRASMLTR